MQVFHINAPAPYYTNTFLVLDSENGCAAAIDPAAAPSEYEALLKEHGAKLTHIFLTHGHHDHVTAVRALRKSTGAQVWLGADDCKTDRLFPMADTDRDHTYTDGDDIAVGGMCFHVIATPGHSKGSVCLQCGDLLFSGDTLFAGEIGRCDLDGGSYPVMLQSLAKLRCEVQGNPQVLPGHEAFSTMDEEKAHNPYLSQV